MENVFAPQQSSIRGVYDQIIYRLRFPKYHPVSKPHVAQSQREVNQLRFDVAFKWTAVQFEWRQAIRMQLLGCELHSYRFGRVNNGFDWRKRRQGRRICRIQSRCESSNSAEKCV